VLTGR